MPLVVHIPHLIKNILVESSSTCIKRPTPSHNKPKPCPEKPQPSTGTSSINLNSGNSSKGMPSKSLSLSPWSQRHGKVWQGMKSKETRSKISSPDDSVLIDILMLIGILMIILIDMDMLMLIEK